MKISLLALSAVLLLSGTVQAQSPYLKGYEPRTGQHDKYLGNLNQNQFDPNSVNNPFGRYGSPYSPDSVRNPFGQYGSPYSPYSPTNPFTSGDSPRIYGR
jgi:hypothetical protein